MYCLMIVEDDPIVRRSLIDTIGWERMGFKVLCSASNGHEALSLLTLHNPDVILVDIAMSGMDGLEFIRTARSMGHDTVFVILSAYSKFEYAQQAISLSVYAYLTKPLDEEQVERTFMSIALILNERSTSLRRQTGNSAASLQEIQKIWILAVLRGQIDGMALYEHKIQFKPNICSKHICVVVITVINNDGCSYETELETWLKNRDCFPVAIDSRTAFIISDSSRTMLRDKVVATVNGLYEHINAKHYDAYVRIGVSGTGAFTETAKLYRQALAAYMDTFFENSGTPIYYNSYKLTSHAKLDAGIVLKLSCDIANAVSGIDKARVECSVNELFSVILHARPERLDDVFITCIEVLMISERYCMEKVTVGFKPFEKAVLYTTLSALNNISQLRTYLKEQLYIMTDILSVKLREMSNDMVWQAISYIKENIEQPITVEDVAGHVNFNFSYLSRVFKKTMGIPMKQFISSLRMDKAKEFLKQSRMSVQEISYQLGFTDYRYFSLLFKKYNGMTPVEYRKMRI